MFCSGGTDDRIASLGADEPSLLAFAPRHDGIHTDEESNLRLIVASSRCPFRAKDGVLLNVECFGPLYKGGDEGDTTGDADASQNKGDTVYHHSAHRRSMHNSDEWPLFLYVHGICESAETWGVQTLAEQCAKHCWRLIVLELAGHGLSGDVGSGSNRILGGVGSVVGRGRATCPDFDELVHHVSEFTVRMRSAFSQSKGMVLSGGSLGGTLVAYAAKGVLSACDESNIEHCANDQDQRKMPQSQRKYPDFYGIALFAPALGIHPGALPPSPVVVALRALSYLLPSHGILTPIEHPTYACPPSSTRNFSGRWPLSTSSMLLDLTSHRVPNDVEEDKMQNQMQGLPSLFVIVGEKDEIVPVSSVEKWFESVTDLSSDKGEKTMVVLKGAGHGFFHERSRGSRKRLHEKNVFVESLFEWLNDRASKDFLDNFCIVK
mmetsp:Transcript_29153/g.61993  ORF Transcript_29153/g.61993 Transcript_29153/m.61993 type:complete len:434 (+) Transcript_29153:73-1374(+)